MSSESLDSEGNSFVNVEPLANRNCIRVVFLQKIPNNSIVINNNFQAKQ